MANEHLFGRSSSPRPRAIRGDGCFITDANGKQYLDGSGGAAVSCLGHADPEVLAAVHAQLDQLPYAHTRFFSTEAAEELADQLATLAPPGIERVYFVSGGSEAVESSLKLARQYFLETGEPTRHRVIARRQSYHGSTLGALAVGGDPKRRQPYLPLLIETSHIAPCYAYHDRHPDEPEANYGQRVANELAAEIERLGPETVMAFIAEPVVGSAAGVVPPVPGYFKQIRDICDSYGVLLILDEIMCGTGRTGTFFAIEQEGISPDITTLAKGLGGGYQPVGAMLCSEKIYQAISEGSGFFQHGHTYLAHPTAMAASRAVVRAIVERDLLSRVRSQGETLANALHERFAQHPHVGDIRGRGLFWALEFVADREHKTPFDPSKHIARRLEHAALDAGLICYPSQGSVDGRQGDHLMLAPPFIISDREIHQLTDKLEQAVRAVV